MCMLAGKGRLLRFRIMDGKSKLNENSTVIFSERFHRSEERIYIQRTNKSNIVMIKKNSMYKESVATWLARIFLPQGYPESVSSDYLRYQKFDTAQAFCSTITGILATQEVLRGVGVGDVAATPLAATVTWVLKDGCGHIGRILFAYTHGKYLDAYSKSWRLYADVLNDAAMCVEIALPYFYQFSAYALCISTGMKAIVGVAGGATRVAMTQHHARLGNFADVAAKDSAQETAVNLLASIFALLLLTYSGNSLVMFVLMMALHVLFNYMAVRAVCLRTLNEPRMMLLMHRYLQRDVIAPPAFINWIEPIVQRHQDVELCGFKIKLGSTLSEVCEIEEINWNAGELLRLRDIYKEGRYLLAPDVKSGVMHVLFKQGATTDDVLTAYFHAVTLAFIVRAINTKPTKINWGTIPSPFLVVVAILQCVEWSKEATEIPNSKYLYKPSADLMLYISWMVHKEWVDLRPRLEEAGWQVDKHLLVLGEWKLILNEEKTHKINGNSTSDIVKMIHKKIVEIKRICVNKAVKLSRTSSISKNLAKDQNRK